MHRSQKGVTPMEVIKADDPEIDPKARRTRAEPLWQNSKIRKATIASLADSVRFLAALAGSSIRI
jgi:hypothetical protein